MIPIIINCQLSIANYQLKEDNTMNQNKKLVLCAVLIFALFLLNCAPTNIMRDPQRLKQKMIALAHLILQNHEDAEPLLELGIILLRVQRYDRGKILLERAYKLNDEDPEILYYYGLSLELCENEPNAFDIYRNYENVSYQSPFRRLMKDRYNHLSRQILKQYAQNLLLQEDQLNLPALSPQAIAVFPLSYQGKNEDFAVLSKGLCEMMITDLSQVKNLQLIERIRLNALMEEMSLAQTGLLNPQTATRFGRLLSAGQILYGVYDVLGEEQFRVTMEIKDLIDPETPALKASSSAELKNLLRLEKRIVFGFIAKMGIQLTQEERRRILHIPTKNMHAFIAYCKGLDRQDAGQFEAAAAYFQQAQQLDPDFDLVDVKIEENQSLLYAVDGNAALNAMEITPSVSPLPISTADLMIDRMQNLSENLQSNLVPGQDSRQSTEEAAISGANIGLGDLPDPPRPPIRR